MRGFFAENTEVAWRADEGLAEMPLPDAIDNHACGERVVRAGDGLGQLFLPQMALKWWIGINFAQRVHI